MTETLTATQKRALAQPERRGQLFARSAAWHGGTQRTYTRTTLQALVDAGAARWAQIPVGESRLPGVVLRNPADAGNGRSPS